LPEDTYSAAAARASAFGSGAGEKYDHSFATK